MASIILRRQIQTSEPRFRSFLCMDPTLLDVRFKNCSSSSARMAATVYTQPADVCVELRDKEQPAFALAICHGVGWNLPRSGHRQNGGTRHFEEGPSLHRPDWALPYLAVVLWRSSGFAHRGKLIVCQSHSPRPNWMYRLRTMRFRPCGISKSSNRLQTDGRSGSESNK
jgi:hypothetical protein